MFKPGDKVRLTSKHLQLADWVIDDSYIILKIINESIIKLDKTYSSTHDIKTIHVDYIKFDINAIRKEKLQRLCSKSEIK